MGIFDKVKAILGDKKLEKPSKDEADNSVEKPKTNPPVLSQQQTSVFDAIIARLFSEVAQISDSLKTSAIYKEINQFPDSKKLDLLQHAIFILHNERSKKISSWKNNTLLLLLVELIVKSNIKLEEQAVVALIDQFSNCTEPYTRDYMFVYVWPINDLLAQVIKQFKGQALSDTLRASLQHIQLACEAYHIGYLASKKKSILKKLDTLLSTQSETEGEITPTYFCDNDAFATIANAEISGFSVAQNNAWSPLLTFAKRASGAKPSAKFLAEASKLVDAVGVEEYKRLVSGWFKSIIQSKDYIPDNPNFVGQFVLCEQNVDMVKGIVWMTASLPDETLAPLLGALADRCFQKIPNKGHASDLLANACLFTLFKLPGLLGISQLSRLKLRVKQNRTSQLITQYLEAAAEQQGMTTNELEDLAVPDFELIDAKRTWQFNDYTAQLWIVGVGKTELLWLKPDGNLLKTVPSFVKEQFADEYKALKETTKQIEQTLTAQRDRIDRMFRSQCSMPFAHFERYFLKHPLVSFLAKNIIWNFTENSLVQSALFLNGRWVKPHETVEFSDKAQVSLWHPAIATVEETCAWRDFFMDNEIVQSLKQAYRELYVLTAAEANTKSYSNRMAAHIIKQHQLASLAKGRGWQYSLMGAWDGGDVTIANLSLAEYDLDAQFWVQSVEGDDALYSASGIWNFVSTDQVRFVNKTTRDVVDLVDIPTIVFSEVMRDVDLFVGVASVGNDPNWSDSGGLPRHQDYWQTYSFGDLSEISKIRKEILSRLMPKLKIKEVAEIKGNFLVVKGKLRTYKIHIGSTNILMEPNDQYLCIVPNQHAKVTTPQVFLPFEGDSGLSIVLSKAFLLADDDKITDSTITSQIKAK